MDYKKTHYLSLVKNYLTALLLSAAVLTVSSCKFFEEPSGKSELLSVYTRDDENEHYIYATLKISNTGSTNIYSSTVSIQADTNQRPYYKTVSLDVTIYPGSCIYIPVEMSFTQKSTETPKETWDKDTIKIISQSYR